METGRGEKVQVYLSDGSQEIGEKVGARVIGGRGPESTVKENVWRLAGKAIEGRTLLLDLTADLRHRFLQTFWHLEEGEKIKKGTGRWLRLT